MKRHGENLNTIAEWKKPIWKDSILYDSNYMPIWERQKYGSSKNISSGQELRAGGREGMEWIGGAQWMFRAVIIFCIIPQWWTTYTHICSNPMNGHHQEGTMDFGDHDASM